TAAGSPVVTTPSAATRSFFPADEIPQPETQEDAEFVLRSLVRSKELRDRTVHKAQRRIWEEHTYTHRAMSVMDAIAIPHTDPVHASVSAIVSTNRPQYLDKIISTHAQQTHADRELVLVTHGFTAPAGFADRAANAGVENLQILEVDSSEPLGACLNRGASAADGTV